MGKQDRTGRSQFARHDNKMKREQGGVPLESRFVQVINSFRREPAWMALSMTARVAYIEIKSRFNGYDNNGRILVSVRWLAEELGCGKNTAHKAIRDLEEKGFIVRMGGGGIGLDGVGSGTLWRLTELGYMGDRPTQDYRNWRPKNKSPSPKRGQSVPKTGILSEVGVPKSGTECPQNRDKEGADTAVHSSPKRGQSSIYHGVVVGDAAAVPPTFTRPRSPSEAETRNQFTCPECGAQHGQPCIFPDDGQGRSSTKRGINHQDR